MDTKPEKTCFVISPIGTEGSETRKMADDFLELLVEPALQSFGFHIVRADKIASPSVITSDIIKYVQASELCLIDLTDHNPNVFYECGRRHENGLPFIQLIRKEEKLPFDVAGIRTISYDLSDPRSVLDSVKAIQNYVRNYEEHGYGGSSTGDSLASVAEGITRIERTLNKFMCEIIWKKDQTENERRISKEIITKHPITAFNDAFDNGDIELCLKILPRIKKLIGTTDWLRSLVLVAQAGEPEAESTLIDALMSNDDITNELAIEGFYGLQIYYNNRNMQEQGIRKLYDIYQKFLTKYDLTNEDKATLLGYIQVFQFQIGKYDESIKTGLEVVKQDRSAIGLSNLAHVYMVMDRIDEAAMYVDEYMHLPDVSEGGLETAYEVYIKLGKDKEANMVKERLQQLKLL